MAITDVVRGNGDGAPKRLTARIGWFVAIWALSTAAFFVVASLLHLIVPR
ncbi:DUF2474 domain-containing protein [Gluconacetobacter sacchari]|uniref:DUF2474 domain-containing protein n=1 Tax=Gluconacetobacter sacchari TaxID=92759 RepID=A0A7W4IFS2_9PROT|nr:DUF2474 domain-containing protein [Gluconacetobacter sacchari]MBB2162053.1 DUF2474 domain-containing protein [Gluconacetobacter sacchari]